MKNALFCIFVSLMLAGCSQLKNASSTSSVVEVANETKPSSKTTAIFHILHPLGIQLILTNVDEHLEKKVLMEKTLSQLDLAPGFWQVSGFIMGGQRYKITNTSMQFIFHLKKGKSTYAGSYIFQCPKVGQAHLKEMKKMIFFNRYPFNSKKGLCEVVIGSDFRNVKRVWMELDKTKHHPLDLGF
jgi:hypothetical protein